ncbi:MAG: hypothetical protein ACFFAU_08430 [Candidatus Hodarchaeota archaeon]
MVLKRNVQTMFLRMMFPYDLMSTHEAKKLLLKLVKAKLELLESQRSRKNLNNKSTQNSTKSPEQLITFKLEETASIVD